MRRLVVLSVLGLLVVAGGWLLPVWAQNPVKTLQKVESKVAPPAAPGSTPEGASSPASPGTPGAVSQEAEDNYLSEGEVLYRHSNERDPFSPLVRTGGSGGVSTDVVVKRGTIGITRFQVEECTLEAILRTSEGVMAWFQGPDGKAYKCVAGDRFADGVVLDISFESGEVSIQQELTDTTAVKPFRNLVLKIRSQVGEGQ